MRNITWYYHRKFAPETKLATPVHIIDLDQSMHGIYKFLRRPLLDWSRVYSARSDGWGWPPSKLDRPEQSTLSDNTQSQSPSSLLNPDHDVRSQLISRLEHGVETY
ncbi:hypothetical protein HZ326_26322 [Fusarium oxysporum f. sp. albedinis]|nr:hypothetical protein HZ326_26322 [Fusarium oxysporum f. sp. albedinis]